MVWRICYGVHYCSISLQQKRLFINYFIFVNMYKVLLFSKIFSKKSGLGGKSKPRGGEPPPHPSRSTKLATSLSVFQTSFFGQRKCLILTPILVFFYKFLPSTHYFWRMLCHFSTPKSIIYGSLTMYHKSGDFLVAPFRNRPLRFRPKSAVMCSRGVHGPGRHLQFWMGPAGPENWTAWAGPGRPIRLN